MGKDEEMTKYLMFDHSTNDYFVLEAEDEHSICWELAQQGYVDIDGEDSTDDGSHIELLGELEEYLRKVAAK